MMVGPKDQVEAFAKKACMDYFEDTQGNVICQAFVSIGALQQQRCVVLGMGTARIQGRGLWLVGRNGALNNGVMTIVGSNVESYGDLEPGVHFAAEGEYKMKGKDLDWYVTKDGATTKREPEYEPCIPNANPSTVTLKRTAEQQMKQQKQKRIKVTTNAAANEPANEPSQEPSKEPAIDT
jgi:hypothetical protein